MTQPVTERDRVRAAASLLVSVVRDEVAGESRDEQKRVALTRAVRASVIEHVGLIVKEAEAVWHG